MSPESIHPAQRIGRGWCEDHHYDVSVLRPWVGRGGHPCYDTERGRWRQSGLYPETSYPLGDAPIAYHVPQQQTLVPEPQSQHKNPDTYDLEDYCSHIHKGAKICPVGTARERVADTGNVKLGV